MQKYSVAIATFNGEKYIGEQILSIVHQTVPPSEIIISDDGSTDNTKKIITRILSKNNISYKIIDNNIEHGVVGNFTNAIMNCSNEIIFTSDQDDVWKENKAQIILNEFDKNQEASLVFTDAELVNSNLGSLNSSLWESVGVLKKDYVKNLWFEHLLRNCLVTGATMAFKKRLFINNIPIPKEWLHDGWLSWMAVLENGLVAVKKETILYRQHANNTIGATPKQNFLKKIRNWLGASQNIPKTRRMRYNRYKSILENKRNEINSKQKKSLVECVHFWEKLINSENKSIPNRILIYSKLFIQGDYNKYFNGMHGFIRDIINCYY